MDPFLPCVIIIAEQYRKTVAHTLDSTTYIYYCTFFIIFLYIPNLNHRYPPYVHTYSFESNIFCACLPAKLYFVSIFSTRQQYRARFCFSTLKVKKRWICACKNLKNSIIHHSTNHPAHGFSGMGCIASTPTPSHTVIYIFFDSSIVVAWVWCVLCTVCSCCKVGCRVIEKATVENHIEKRRNVPQTMFDCHSSSMIRFCVWKDKGGNCWGSCSARRIKKVITTVEVG